MPDAPDWTEGEHLRRVLTLPDHRCEMIADFSPRMTGEREEWVGRLLEPIEGYPEEKWCWHIKTGIKPEIVFGFNEADFEYLPAIAYAALGRHINPTWIEAVAESAKLAVQEKE